MLLPTADEPTLWDTHVTIEAHIAPSLHTGYLTLYLHLWWCLQDKQWAQRPVCVRDGSRDGGNNSSASSTKIGEKNNRQRIWRLIISWRCRYAFLTLWSRNKFPVPEVMLDVLKEWAICLPSSLWQSWMRACKVLVNKNSITPPVFAVPVQTRTSNWAANAKATELTTPSIHSKLDNEPSYLTLPVLCFERTKTWHFFWIIFCISRSLLSGKFYIKTHFMNDALILVVIVVA